jgi:hypothetical protein
MELSDSVRNVLAVDEAEFRRRVEEDAERVLAEIERGAFDNPQGNVGLEYEFYAVSDPDDDYRGAGGTLARVPRRLLEYVGFEKELGLHNAELSTRPDPLNGHGLRTQESAVCARLEAAREPMRAEGLRLVSDGVWTVPPAGETGREYLTDSVEDGSVRLATNMSASARYHAMANSGASVASMTMDVPNVTLSADTVMPESLTTSIQPHYQLPRAENLPEYFRYALRVAGPLLAPAVNSPFLPPDLYDDVAPDRILADAHHEHRIAAFESVMNDGARKVRFPEEIENVAEAVHRVAEDEVMVPMPVERGERFDDEFAHFRAKHGTFWRWVRPVFGGRTRSAANARIEFRPLPGQPTVRDGVAFQAAFAGVVVGLRRADHPVASLDWETARENFYAAAREGLGAELSWIDAEGRRTTDSDRLYDDLLAHAGDGLKAQGLAEAEVRRYLAPIRTRVETDVTPASWKRSRVADQVDGGEGFAEAVAAVGREYLDRQEKTLTAGTFADWL